MDYLQILADHVNDKGEITKTLTPDGCPELLSYNGKNISAALTGQYNYGKIKPLPLNNGVAPGSYWDRSKLSEYHSELWEGSEAYGHHWCLLEDLFKMDFQRKVISIRDSKLWRGGTNNNFTAAYNDMLIRNQFVTIEEFIGEQFLEKMKKLQEQGYNRITVRLK